MSCAGADEVSGEKIHVRRKCGCVKHNEEIKELLKRFSTVPPSHTTPKTSNPSPASRDEEELDIASLTIQKIIPCDGACEKLFKDKKQWLFHGKYGETCSSSDKASASPCPPEMKNQWTHYGLNRPTPTGKERSYDSNRYNPQPQSEKLEKYMYASNYKAEKNAPCQMGTKAPPKYPRGPQPLGDKFPEDLGAIKLRDLDKNQSKRFTKLMENMLQFIQLLFTCIAILIYYCIFCYMHLVYFTLRGAIYFHQADAAMKTTIAVVTVTSLVIALNVLMKFERLLGMAQ